MSRKSALSGFEKGKLWLLRIKDFRLELPRNKLKKFAGVILNFLGLKDDYGTKMSLGRSTKLPQREKEHL